MISFILFLVMCFSMAVLAIGIFWQNEGLLCQRFFRLCIVLLVSGILFQGYVFKAVLPQNVIFDSIFVIPVIWLMNLLCCAVICGIVWLIRWIWVGK